MFALADQIEGRYAEVDKLTPSILPRICKEGLCNASPLENEP